MSARCCLTNVDTTMASTKFSSMNEPKTISDAKYSVAHGEKLSDTIYSTDDQPSIVSTWKIESAAPSKRSKDVKPQLSAGTNNAARIAPGSEKRGCPKGS